MRCNPRSSCILPCPGCPGRQKLMWSAAPNYPVRTAVLALVAAFSACAQQYSFRSFTQAEGLTDLTVNSLPQDRTGFLRIATNNGLFRYNGHRFVRENMHGLYPPSGPQTREGQFSGRV